MMWILILLALVALVLAAACICYRLAFVVPKQQKKSIKLPGAEQYLPYKEQTIRMLQHAFSIPYEEVWTKAPDGVQLFAKYYESNPGAPLQIMFHGYQSVAERDFSGGMPFALEQGYNVLLVDQRAHGKSGGRCLTFGIRERYDCLAWINFALARFGPDTKIVLYGMSMGAATVLMASGLSLPENVRGIVADCGYTSPEAILKKVLRDRRYPVPLVYPLIRLGARIYGGFDPEAATVPEVLSRCNIPVCLIHGEDDRFVPCDMSRENFAACASENKRLHTFPEAGHGISYFLDQERYLNEILAFLKSCLK